MNPTGYIRQRAGLLEAVICIGEKKVRKMTGLRVGQEDEANCFLADLLRELGAVAPGAAPAVVADEALTLEEWGRRWVKDRRARGITSAADEEAHLRYHVNPDLGSVPLRALTKAQMVAWVRTLRGRKGIDSDKPLSPRYIHHIAGTVKRLLSEAVDMDLLTVSPCIWKSKRDLPPKRDGNASKRQAGGFRGWEVWALTHDARIPEDRRVLYALEFLTGARTGEASPRVWSDLDLAAQPLARLDVKTAWNTRMKLEKGTKTLVEKVIPVHPLLCTILASWKAKGWKEYVGREPKADDLIVPSPNGKRRGVSHSNKLFQDDVKRLGLEKVDGAGQAVVRTHYETRSTFRSLALGGGAVERDVNRITHPSPREASDLYARLDEIWPVMCRAVECIRVAPKEGSSPSSGEVAVRVADTGEVPVSRSSAKKKAPKHGALEPSSQGHRLARDTGFEPVALSSGG